MSPYVVYLLGRFSPPLTIDFADITENLPSFSVTVEKGMVKAEPHPHIQLETNEARERLQDEISPLLRVFGLEEGRALSLMVTDIIYPDFTQATRSIPLSAALSKSPPTEEEVRLKLAWATADPIYRELLDFYIEALAAANPRPIGSKMKERLKVKFNGYENALKKLAMSKDGFALINDDQSRYKGDRHADYKLGEVPEQLSPQERNEILTLLKNIIQHYERYVCSKTIT